MRTSLSWRYYCLFLIILAAAITTGCNKTSGGISPLLFLGGGGAPGPASLDAPQNVKASTDTYNDKVVISWDAVTGADHYHVYRSDAVDGTYTQIGTDVAGTSTEDTGLDPESTFFYKVVACDSDDAEGDVSDAVTGSTAAASLPNPPATVSATNGTLYTRVTITWSAVAEADHYHLYRCATIDGTYAQVGGDVNDLTYDDTTATPAGTTYYYKVKSCTAANDESAFSTLPATGKIGVLPGAPQNVTATNGTYNDKLVLTWDAVSGANHYHVYRCGTIDGSYTQLGTDVTGTTVDDTTGTPGTTYYYKVRACNPDDAEGAWSDAASGKIGTFPNAPGNVTATMGTYTDKVRIAWDSVSGADHYHVYRSGEVDGTYAKIGEAPSSPLDDETAIANTHYYYKVTAVNAFSEESVQSSSAEGYSSPLPPLDAPTGVTASDRTSTSTVSISWNSVSGATYYRVFRALKSDGDYVQIGGDIAGTSTADTDTFEDLIYYYKVKAYDATRESAFSACDPGRCELTCTEYLLRFNINWEYMMTNLTNNTGFPPSGAATYDITGANGGTVHVVVTVPGINQAKTVFTSTNYNDLGMLFSGTETTACNWSGTGTHIGTLNTTGSYIGTIVENLHITSRVRDSGTFTVTYNGSTEAINFTSTWGPGIKISTPAHVSASQGTQSSKVVISWAPVYGVNKYRVYRSTTSGGTYTQVGSDVVANPSPASGTVYSLDDNTGNTTHYFYKVRAFNDYVLNDLDGSGDHQSNETPWSAYSNYAEGWGL